MDAWTIMAIVVALLSLVIAVIYSVLRTRGRV
jgi:hypothetical protein